MKIAFIDEKPIAGIIHKPFEKSTSWAWVGHGGNMVDNSASVSEHSLLKISTRFLGSQELCHRFSISRWWCQGCRQGQSRWRCHCRPCWRRWYSFETCIRSLSIYVGYKAVSLFEGVAEAYIHTTLIKKWDLCPGHAIIKAYGGNMSKLDGSEINYKYARFSPI